MPISLHDYSPADQQIWDEELADFVPQRILDSHIHLFDPRHLTGPDASKVTWGLADLATLKAWAERLYPGRETHFLALGTPLKAIDVAAHNRWCLDEIAGDPNSRLNRLVTPKCRVEDIERDLRSAQVIGLKPYRIFSVTGDIAECRIEEFLTHEQMELANEHGAWVTMHLSRFHGCADEQNLRDLTEYTTRRYPRIRWILAHAARSFTYWPIRQAIDRLRDLPQLWYDVSAVTDIRPLITLFQREDRRRIWFGSDGIDATYFHGQYAALGRAWQAVDADRAALQFPHCDGRPILAIYEQLLSIKQAIEIAEWTTEEVEGLFWRNASEALGIAFREDAGDQTPAFGVGEIGSKTAATYERAKGLIPGGTQLLSKRPEMFAPGCWPAYAASARGCEVVDLDGRRLIDMTTSGIGSCLLGYADPDVTAAVRRRVAQGSMSSLNAAEEVDLAEELIAVHPWAEQARFARSGGEAMSIAVRIARAATGRDRIAFCGYHGWSDWYLAANHGEATQQTPQTPADGAEQAVQANEGGSGHDDSLRAHLLPGLDPTGVPRGLAGTALPFTYNRLDELRQRLTRYGNEIAAVVMEPTRSVDPQPGFLEGVRELCDEHGAVLLFDEISAGWRMHLGGAHLKYGVQPDIAVFAKALGNGHPMAAIIGRRHVMDAAQKSFISSTYWTEAVGPTAALATIRKLRQLDAVSHVTRIGERMRTIWTELGTRHGVPAVAAGHAALLKLSFDHPQAAELSTLLTAKMLARGFLVGGGFYPSYAHRDSHLDAFAAAADEAFAELAVAIHNDDLRDRLAKIGVDVRHTGFGRLN
ncbi:MAG: aminotransferase class III-fold pyridoxal phosphate-dependent enzyme [Planctomycetaceae bacterium]|nr:MAG: aminotransferase class III-fold pyridoxal phosphate-dependent enzyme [Planctomycetaceae bacterium]